MTLSFFDNQSILSPYTTRTQNDLSFLNFNALTPLKVMAINAIHFEQLMIDDLEIRMMGNAALRSELAKKINWVSFINRQGKVN